MDREVQATECGTDSKVGLTSLDYFFGGGDPFIEITSWAIIFPRQKKGREIRRKAKMNK